MANNDISIQRRIAFLNELRELFLKYDAELAVYDEYTGYAECGRDLQITVEFKDWRMDDVKLGEWFCPMDDVSKKC